MIMTQIAVIFDMDGVIVDTNPYHLITYQQFWNEREIYPTDEDLRNNMFGKSNRYILEYFFQKTLTEEEITHYEDIKEGLFRAVYEPHVSPISGFLAFFYDLKKNKAKTGIATSAPRANLDLILSKIPLADGMESLMASEDVIHHKPNPEVYLTTMATLGVLPQHTVIFEDSFSGITAAKASGAKVVGVLSSHQPSELPPCDAYIDNYLNIDYRYILNLL
jgi:beta-phosphoglucomutase